MQRPTVKKNRNVPPMSFFLWVLGTEQVTHQFIWCLIVLKYGRIIVIATLICEIVGMVIYFTVLDIDYDDPVKKRAIIKKWLKGTGIAFFVLAVLLSVCIIWLVNRLKKKRDQVSQSEEDKSLFNSEIRTLWIILATFTITYIVRGAWDWDMDPML